MPDLGSALAGLAVTRPRGRRRRQLAGWHRRRWAVAAGFVALLVSGGGAAAWASIRPSGPAYRTAVAGVGTVEQTLAEPGTIEPAHEAVLNFPISGQVSSVAVTPGQRVAAGSVLASLDASPLSAAVAADQSTLTEDQAKLAADEEAEASGGAPSASGSSGTASDAGSGNAGGQSPARTDPPSSAAANPSSQLSELDTQVRQDEVALTSDLEQVHTALSLAQTDQQQAAQACQALSVAGTGSGSTGSEAGTGSESGSAAGPTSTSGGSGAPPASSAQTAVSCQSDEQQAMSAEVEEANDDQALTSDLSSLLATIDQLVSSATAGPTSGAVSGASSPTPGSSSSPTASSPTPSTPGGSGAPSVTQSQVDSDQASVDAAEAELAQAERSLSEATLVSPISGTVAQVNLVDGEQVPQASSSLAPPAVPSTAQIEDAEVVVIDPGSYDVNTSVSDADVSEVAVGEPVTVTTTGSSAALVGRVSQVSLLANQSGGTTVYPVTVALRSDPTSLRPDEAAMAQIVVRQVVRATRVPTSAVHTVGRLAFVQELRQGKLETHPVVVGAVGSLYTQLESGLSPGARVVLANLHAKVPTSNTTTLRGLANAVGALAGPGGGARVVVGPSGVVAPGGAGR